MPWTNEPPFTDPRYFLAAAMCNAPAPGSGSGIYAIGGVDTSSSQNGDPVSTDPVHDEWVPKQQMQRGEWGWPPRRHPTDLSAPSAAWQPTPYS
jgi:hypothetical protein